MLPTRAEAALVLGVVIVQLSCRGISSVAPECWATVQTCMSDLCMGEQAFRGGICQGGSCQIMGSEGCNMTIQTALDQFPSLRGCVCTWEQEPQEEEEEEEGLCDSIQALAKQCSRHPASRRKRSTLEDWKSSALIGQVYDGARSCFHQMQDCLRDTVFNRQLVPLILACSVDPCNPDLCQQAARAFYGGMPQNVAEMLVMCECDTWDESCLQRETSLHSGPCAEEARTCQERVRQCLDDGVCRGLLKTLRAKCWGHESDECGHTDLRGDVCLATMDPALMNGSHPECKMAFIATMGTVLHHPCSCNGVHPGDLRTCNRIHDVLHDRSVFRTPPLKSSSPSSKPPETDESDHHHMLSNGYLPFALATILLAGVLVLMPLAIYSKIWMLRKMDQTKFHHPQKSHCVVIP